MHPGNKPLISPEELRYKICKFIYTCGVCQEVKHPSRSTNAEERSHLPETPGELGAIDLYGNLSSGRGGVKYILVCLDVFCKHYYYIR
jgi:hypothetical protein